MRCHGPAEGPSRHGGVAPTGRGPVIARAQSNRVEGRALGSCAVPAAGGSELYLRYGAAARQVAKLAISSSLALPAVITARKVVVCRERSPCPPVGRPALELLACERRCPARLTSP